MWPESSEHKQPLRTGLTTGTCATACCVAATKLLLANQSCQQVSVTLPKGKIVELVIEDLAIETEAVEAAKLDSCKDKTAIAATIKDAGDDPDVTHGARVWVKVALTPNQGCHFVAGKGVGTVTRTGLMLAVGEPAINPVPRQMMTQHLQTLAQRLQYRGGFIIEIGVDKGEQLAQKTMNSRLGIEGGLSILGTTGIVRPFSCSAWIASIHQGMDVVCANGFDMLAATTGNTSEAFVKEKYQLTDMQLIEMGDFAGAVLKYLRKAPVPKVVICGGFGKLTKLANGYLDLHSSRSTIDFAQLGMLAQQLGAKPEVCDAVAKANTSIESLNICQQHGIDLASKVCSEAYQQAQRYVPSGVSLEIIAIDRQGQWLGQALGQAA